MRIEGRGQIGDAAVMDILLEQEQQAALVMRLEKLQVEESFGLVGTGDGQCIVIDTQDGEGS